MQARGCDDDDGGGDGIPDIFQEPNGILAKSVGIISIEGHNCAVIEGGSDTTQPSNVSVVLSCAEAGGSDGGGDPPPPPPPGSGTCPVGGTVELLGDSETPDKASGSPGRDYAAPVAAAVAVAVVALAAGGWYARRRFRQRRI